MYSMSTVIELIMTTETLSSKDILIAHIVEKILKMVL
jgi:hypothetical protein